MTEERFNELLNGPLAGGLPMFSLTRLALALRHVVEATGDCGEHALEDWCAWREEQDSADDEDGEGLDQEGQEGTI